MYYGDRWVGDSSEKRFFFGGPPALIYHMARLLSFLHSIYRYIQHINSPLLPERPPARRTVGELLFTISSPPLSSEGETRREKIK